MENQETLTSDVLLDNLDLTLRLGLPFQGIQKQENARENWLKQDREVDASVKFFANNVHNGANSPSTFYDNSNTPIPSILGSDNIGSSNENLKICKDCGSKTTPLWRKGPTGPQTLCNACGLRYARLVKRLA